MSMLENPSYPIRAVVEMTGVSAHLLRQWEERVPQLKPERDTKGRRRYTPAQVDIVRRIKHLRLHEKLTFKGIARRIAQELHGEGRPKSDREIIELIDAIEGDVRSMLDLLDSGPRR